MLSSDVQRSFRPVLDRVEHRGEQVTILRCKTVAAVLLPVTRYQSAQAALPVDGRRRDQEAGTYDDLRKPQIR
jgi:PHD/YefM family antitoxin component YafN of YafNO toxin-antitoxin module